MLSLTNVALSTIIYKEELYEVVKLDFCTHMTLLNVGTCMLLGMVGESIS